jgi:hypothetical protein
LVLLAFALLASSLAAQTATNAPPLLAPADGEMAPTFWEQHRARDVWEQHPGLVLTGVSAGLGLIGLIVWLAVRPRPLSLEAPEQVARAALQKIQPLPEDGTTLVAVSQILRRYVATRCGLPPGQLTTTEFCAALAGSQKPGPEMAAGVAAFLRECDRRKFSRSNPGAPLDAVNRALQMISEMEQYRAAAAVQDS